MICPDANAEFYCRNLKEGGIFPILYGWIILKRVLRNRMLDLGMVLSRRMLSVDKLLVITVLRLHAE